MKTHIEKSQCFQWLTETRCRERKSLKWSRFRNAVLPLDIGEMDCTVNSKAIEEIVSHAENSDLGYSPSQEKTRLRSILAEYYRDIGITVDIPNIQIVGGQLFAISEVLRLSGDNSKNVVILGPAYPGLIDAIRLAGRSPIVVNLKRVDEKLSIDIEALSSVFREGAEVLLTTYPHVPTGAIFDEKDALELSILANRHNVKIVLDCAYRFFLKRTENIFLRELFNNSRNIAIIESVTKCWSISSIRGGWIVFSNVSDADNFRELSYPRLSPPTALFDAVSISCMTNGFDWLENARAAININVQSACYSLSTEVGNTVCMGTGFVPFVWINLRKLGFSGDRPCLSVLRRAKVSLDEGAQYGLGWEAYGRMNVACHPNVLELAIERISSSAN